MICSWVMLSKSYPVKMLSGLRIANGSQLESVSETAKQKFWYSSWLTSLSSISLMASKLSFRKTP